MDALQPLLSLLVAAPRCTAAAWLCKAAVAGKCGKQHRSTVMFLMEGALPTFARCPA